jgi:hypothetical protein
MNGGSIYVINQRPISDAYISGSLELTGGDILFSGPPVVDGVPSYANLVTWDRVE